MIPPKNLLEMVEFIEYQKKILLECNDIKENINLISNNVKVLGKINLVWIVQTNYFNYIIYELILYLKKSIKYKCQIQYTICIKI